ncbi:hypothetical protein RBB77_23320 (plasmid) [Tunturibacter psychrotolerans]|uniref:Uncharacterized protein n=1 Tax=Tunturiibacter psychrotolerans TaxID=3069686 RepID=A0AAU7ZXH6_9BACT
MALTADQAVQLAVEFHDLSTSVANARFNNWNSLAPADRSELEDIQWTLMNYSSDFATISMTATLASLPNVLQNIKNATQQANNALQTIAIFTKIITVASAAAVLGAAIASDNPNAIMQSAASLLTAATT